MPCYLFTYHGHSTWLPDHPRGFVHRQQGLQKSDPHMAAYYRANMLDDPVVFDDQMQDIMIAVSRNAGPFMDAIVHAVATEPTHIHVLISWKHDREGKSIRASVRSAISRELNQSFDKRDWFSDSPSRKRTRNHEHFDYLLLEYLPDHRKCWAREEDRIAAEKRDALREQPVRGRRKAKRLQRENNKRNAK